MPHFLLVELGSQITKSGRGPAAFKGGRWGPQGSSLTTSWNRVRRAELQASARNFLIRVFTVTGSRGSELSRWGAAWQRCACQPSTGGEDEEAELTGRLGRHFSKKTFQNVKH